MSRKKWAVVVAVVCLVVAAVAVAYAAGRAKAVPVQEVVRARRFEVVDGKGMIRAQLALTGEYGGGVSLDLCDKRGKARAGIAVSDKGPTALTLTDEGHVPRVQVVVSDGMASVYLLGRRATTSLDITHDSPLLEGLSTKERARVKAAFEESGGVRAAIMLDDQSDNARVVLFDKEGKLLWQAP